MILKATECRPEDLILFEDVSKFYGETLGVNRVNLALPPGITSLVGPNGAGKSTLMGLMTGLLSPTRGKIRVRGMDPHDPVQMFRRVGFCSQFDSFPPGLTGIGLLAGFLGLHGRGRAWAQERAYWALEKVKLVDAANRRVAGYSKGMRQRVKLALAIAHDPEVLVLDEPLNGLDPLARAEVIALLREMAECGRHIFLSSHILHEVDIVSDQVVLLNAGYIVAEGDIRAVRSEMVRHPLSILIRCDKPQILAAQAVAADSVVEIKIDPSRQGVVVRTEDADGFYRLLNKIVLESGVRVESVAPLDEDVQAVYQYLIEDRRKPS